MSQIRRASSPPLASPPSAPVGSDARRQRVSAGVADGSPAAVVSYQNTINQLFLVEHPPRNGWRWPGQTKRNPQESPVLKLALAAAASDGPAVQNLIRGMREQDLDLHQSICKTVELMLEAGKKDERADLDADCKAGELLAWYLADHQQEDIIEPNILASIHKILPQLLTKQSAALQPLLRAVADGVRANIVSELLNPRSKVGNLEAATILRLFEAFKDLAQESSDMQSKVARILARVSQDRPLPPNISNLIAGELAKLSPLQLAELWGDLPLNSFRDILLPKCQTKVIEALSVKPNIYWGLEILSTIEDNEEVVQELGQQLLPEIRKLAKRDGFDLSTSKLMREAVNGLYIEQAYNLCISLCEIPLKAPGRLPDDAAKQVYFASDTDLAEICETYALCLITTGAPREDILAACNRALALEPGHMAAYSAAKYLVVEAGDPEAALRFLSHCQAARKENYEVQALVYETMGSYGAAQDSYLKLTRYLCRRYKDQVEDNEDTGDTAAELLQAYKNVIEMVRRAQLPVRGNVYRKRLEEARLALVTYGVVPLLEQIAASDPNSAIRRAARLKLKALGFGSTESFLLACDVVSASATLDAEQQQCALSLNELSDIKYPIYYRNRGADGHELPLRFIDGEWLVKALWIGINIRIFTIKPTPETYQDVFLLSPAAKEWLERHVHKYADDDNADG